MQTPITVLRGSLYDEVHQRINSWIHQVVTFLSQRTCLAWGNLILSLLA